MAPTLGSPHFWTSLVFGNQLPCDAATMRHMFPLRMLTLRQDGSRERPKAFGIIFGTLIRDTAPLHQYFRVLIRDPERLEVSKNDFLFQMII